MALTRVLWSRSGPPMQRLLIRSTSTQVEVSFRCLTCLHHWQGARCNFGPFDTTPCMNLVHRCKSVAFHRNMAVGSWFKISIMTSQVTCQVSSKSSRAKSKGIGTLRPSLILRISWKSLQFAQREIPQIGEVEDLISVAKTINGQEQMKSEKVCTWIWC
jgi:hypothetical protein